MSDSDGIPGEVEYSDDEDFIRNDSVLSARHTKIAEGSLVAQSNNHPVLYEKPNKQQANSENSEDEREREESPTQSLDPPKQKEKVQLPTEQSQHAQASQRKAEVEVQNRVAQPQVVQDRNSRKISVEAQAQPVQEQYPAITSQSPLQQKAQKKQEEPVNSEESNDDDEGYRETYFSEETAAKKQKQSQLVIEVPKQEQNKHPGNSHRQNEQPDIVQAQNVPKDIPETNTQQQYIKAQNQIFNQQKEPQKKEEQQVVEEKEEQERLIQRQFIEEKSQPKSKVLPAQKSSQSQHDLFAGLNVVAASNNSEYTEKQVQRKLFKSDIPKEDDNVSVPFSSEYVAVQRISQSHKQNSALQELTTMNVQQRKLQPKELSNRKEDKSGPTGQACKCVIM